MKTMRHLFFSLLILITIFGSGCSFSPQRGVLCAIKRTSLPPAAPDDHTEPAAPQQEPVLLLDDDRQPGFTYLSLEQTDGPAYTLNEIYSHDSRLLITMDSWDSGSGNHQSNLKLLYDVDSRRLLGARESSLYTECGFFPDGKLYMLSYETTKKHLPNPDGGFFSAETPRHRTVLYVYGDSFDQMLYGISFEGSFLLAKDTPDSFFVITPNSRLEQRRTSDGSTVMTYDLSELGNVSPYYDRDGFYYLSVLDDSYNSTYYRLNLETGATEPAPEVNLLTAYSDIYYIQSAPQRIKFAQHSLPDYYTICSSEHALNYLCDKDSLVFLNVGSFLAALSPLEESILGVLSVPDCAQTSEGFWPTNICRAGETHAAVTYYDSDEESTLLFITEFSAAPEGLLQLTTYNRNDTDTYLAEYRERLLKNFGIHLYSGEEATFLPFDDYKADALTDNDVALEIVAQVFDFMSLLPEGMLEELLVPPAQELAIYVCGALHPDNDEAIDSAVALTNTSSSSYAIVINGASSLYQLRSTLMHEFMHLMEERIVQCQWDNDILYTSFWPSIKPEHLPNLYAYTYNDENGNLYSDDDYTATGHNRPDDEVLFIDSYSRTYPHEDRARVMEYLFMAREGNLSGNTYYTDEYFTSYPYLKLKAQYLCALIRACFPSAAAVPYGELPWEALSEELPISYFVETYS